MVLLNRASVVALQQHGHSVHYFVSICLRKMVHLFPQKGGAAHTPSLRQVTTNTRRCRPAATTKVQSVAVFSQSRSIHHTLSQMYQKRGSKAGIVAITLCRPLASLNTFSLYWTDYTRKPSKSVSFSWMSCLVKQSSSVFLYFPYKANYIFTATQWWPKIYLQQ